MKKLFKKATALLLSLVLILSIAPLSASALSSDETLSYLIYEINGDEVTITGYKPVVTEQLIIPESIDGLPVTAIGENAFENCRGIDEIVLPDTLETIGDFAFAKSSIDKVVIPGSVKSIGDYAYFECCIEDITLENGIERIGDYAFYEALDLYPEQEYFVPLIIPASVTHIGYLAFIGDINIPFVIEVDPNNQYYSSEDNVLFNKDKTVLIQFSSARGGDPERYGESYTIPDSVEAIFDYAFYGEWPVTELTFGKNVKTIGDYAFYKNKCICKINFNDGLETIGEGAFCNSSDIEYNLPDSVTSIGVRAFATHLTHRIDIPSGVTSINTNAFGCAEYVFIPVTVTSIAKNAFSRGLKAIYYEGSEEQWIENIGAKTVYLHGADLYFNVYNGPHEHIGDSWQVTKEATETENGEMTLYCSVCYEVIETQSVDKLAPKITDIDLADMRLNYEDTAKLNLTVTTDGDVNYTVKYTVSDDSVISVNQKGEVTGLKRGSAKVTVTVTDSNGNRYQDTCKVKVKYNLRQWIICIFCFGWLWM